MVVHGLSAAEESDEAQSVGQRLQPEIAKLHVKALGLSEAQQARDQLEKMPGVLSVVTFQNLSCGGATNSGYQLS